MQELRLENFRCFADQSIAFKTGINLLIGDNASGKTSILKACKYVLSSFFSGFSDINTKWISPGIGDFRVVVTNNGIVLPEQPISIYFKIGDVIEYSDSHNDYNEECYVLTKNSKKSSRSLIAGISEYKNYAHALQKGYISESGQYRSLPLFASFSTEDIHSTRKINKNKFKTYNLSPSFGYYECLEGDGFFSYWIYRLLVLQEGREGHPEITIVRNAILEALGQEGCDIIQDIQIRPIQKKVYYIFTDGREVEADFLSDGYRRLVNIITDIAFRCALLNRGIFGENTCRETKGTVLIDEVDLHLHPKLQSKVLKGLRRAFPNIQFIVSSHAPMVMSGVESNDENVVYKLNFSTESGYSMLPVNTYGLDVSKLTDIVLEQTPRAVEVDQELSRLFDLIDADQNEQAKALLLEMQERFGNNLPELARAEAMLNCVIEDDDEENI